MSFKEESTSNKKYKIKLKEGDACSIYGLTVEQYHAVAKRFIDDGAEVGFYSPYCHRGLTSDDLFLEWYWERNDLVHTDCLESNATLYTYEQIMEEESNMNTFTKKDLRTGMLVVNGYGEIGMVLLGTGNGDIISGGTWFPLETLQNDLTRGHGGRSDIVEVWCPTYNSTYLNEWSKPDLQNGDYKLIWKREVPETKEQKEQRELKERYEAVKKELEELGKKLGIQG